MFDPAVLVALAWQALELRTQPVYEAKWLVKRTMPVVVRGVVTGVQQTKRGGNVRIFLDGEEGFFVFLPSEEVEKLGGFEALLRWVGQPLSAMGRVRRFWGWTQLLATAGSVSSG
ncbi:MAG: hypothetical protein JSR82_13135 [Verrucomicrobia bacterium]|nr:hypothetical protein [Verrucomicrobiota bacterium]